MTDHSQIEQQLTMLLRRVQSIHVSTSSGEIDLDRSAYGILCQLADHGPHRLGVLAQTFRLDPSTITRQVQSLESAGLVVRTTDPGDRRAHLLDVSEEGARALATTRDYRRARLRAALQDWDDDDRREFGRLLEKFNTAVENLPETGGQ